MRSARLVLASGSPRRAALLREAGYAFDVRPSDIDESQYPPALPPVEVAAFLARGKAAVALTAAGDDEVVLAADTIVVHGHHVIGKPTNATHAIAMLTSLAGSKHEVITAIVIAAPSGIAERQVRSTVHMRPLSADQVAAYVATGHWQGKAGGYGIQDERGKADPFVQRLTGSLTNIVGLPMEATAEMLAAAGILPSSRDTPREGSAQDHFD